MFRSVLKWNSIYIDRRLSIGRFPDHSGFLEDPRPARVFVFIDLFNRKIGSLTDSPATLYRCDPIEGCTFIPYSENHVRGFRADKIL